MMGQVRAGDHVVASRALFGSCRWVVEDLLPRFGVACTLVDGTRPRRVAPAPCAARRQAFFLESPSNPTLEVIDIAAVARIAHEAGATLTVDNVFATPLCQKPLALGRRLRRLFGDEAHRRAGPMSRRRDPRLEPSSSRARCSSSCA